MKHVSEAEPQYKLQDYQEAQLQVNRCEDTENSLKVNKSAVDSSEHARDSTQLGVKKQETGCCWKTADRMYRQYTTNFTEEINK